MPRGPTQSQLKKSVISSNIANTNTTRTPEGGPYQPKEVICENHKCDVVSYAESIIRYLPDHPDADEHGYVHYPDIDLFEEMDKLIQATRQYEEASALCQY